MAIRYCPKFIKSLATSPIVALPRQVRKILFKHHIWKPRETSSSYQIHVISKRNISDKRRVNTGVNIHNLVKIKLNPYQIIKDNNLCTTKCLTAGVLNAQSTRNKTDIIRDSIIEHDIDIMALTETWLTSKAKDEYFVNALSLSGYKLYSVPRKGNQGHGGVAILHKANLKVHSKSENASFDSFEHCQICLTTGSRCLSVIVIYRPPPSNKNKLSTKMFLDQFSIFLQDCLSVVGDLVIVGDLNFHLDRPSEPDPNRLLTLLDSMNYEQHVVSATHRSGHILDVVISRSNENVIQNITVSDMISDHNLVLFKVKHPKPSPLRVKVITRKLRNVDISEVKQDILASTMSTSDDPSILTECYDRTLSSIIDKHAPSKIKMITIRPTQPWFTDDLHQAKCDKRKAERRWRNTGLVVHKYIFRSVMTKYSNMLKDAQTRYYNTQIIECVTNMKALSRMMNNIMNRKKNVKLPVHTSAETLANTFANYFDEKVHNIRSALIGDTSFNIELPSCASVITDFTPVSEDELGKIITRSPTKGCSLDPLPTWMLKSVMNELLHFMSDIVNASLTTGQVPDSMKVAIITPVLKKPTLDQESLKNYRPVSNLSFLSKILEKVVACRLHAYMKDNNLHDPLQSAYKPGHSTETALIKIQNDLLRTVDDHGVAILVILDLSAAFDTVDHKVLLQRLNDIGICGTAHKWFQSYLTSRTQYIKIDQSTSVVLELLFGVPQGSVLGPLLFLIYLLPLQHLIRSHGMMMHGYADDTQLYLTFSNPSDPDVLKADCQRVEKCLSDIHSWMTCNKLKLNSDKTDIMLLGTRKYLTSIHVSSVDIAGTAVLVSKGPIRNLGVELDSSLTMVQHVSQMVKSASFNIHNIGRIRRRLTDVTAQTLVQSLVISRLDYCNALLCGLPDNQISRLQIVQNKAARLITLTKKTDHITPVLKSLHWLPIKLRIDFKVLLMVYKALHDKAPQYIRDMLLEHKPTRQLRSSSSNCLCEPRTKLKSAGDRAFSAYAPRLWNKLSLEVKQAGSTDSFKKQLKTHLFRQHYQP